MSDVHHQKERTARKAYTCDECGKRGRTGEISPGTRYVYYSGIFEGEPYSGHMCLRCQRAWRRAWQRWRWHCPEDGPGVGGLLEFLRESRWDRRWARDKDVRDRIKRLRADGQNKAADAWEAARRG